MKLYKRISTRKKLLWVGLVAMFSIIGAGSLYASQVVQFMTIVASGSVGSAFEMGRAQTVANEFFHKINPGATLTRTGMMDLQPGNRRVWQFEYQGQGGLDIDAQSEKVTFFFNKKRRKELADEPPSATRLTKEVALEKSKNQARLLGIEIGDSSGSAVLNERPGEAWGSWDFSWPREKNGYKFKTDRIVLAVDTLQGKILAYNFYWISDDPASTEASISQNDARDTAIKTASANGFGLSPSAGHLLIINPNYKWTSNFVKMPPKETRLAWVFDFDNSKDNWTHEAEVWIDAATGEMLGGEQSK